MAAIAIPSEFDLELESERHRWLRRRFLWLCAISILVTIALDAHDVRRALRSPRGRNEGFIEACECAASVLLYALAAAYAVAARPPRRRGRWPLGRLAMVLVVVVGLAEMGFERARVDLLSPKDLPPEAFGPATRGIAFASVALVVLFTNHFFACLFMPWTFGESLRTAAARQCMTDINCFVAGTPVLVAIADAPPAVAAAQASGLPGIPRPMSDEERRELGLGLIMLGLYGAYFIQRCRGVLFLKKAAEEQAGFEPVEMPLRSREGKRGSQKGSALQPDLCYPFCVQPIC